MIDILIILYAVSVAVIHYILWKRLRDQTMFWVDELKTKQEQLEKENKRIQEILNSFKKEHHESSLEKIPNT